MTEPAPAIGTVDVNLLDQQRAALQAAAGERPELAGLVNLLDWMADAVYYRRPGVSIRFVGTADAEPDPVDFCLCEHHQDDHTGPDGPCAEWDCECERYEWDGGERADRLAAEDDPDGDACPDDPDGLHHIGCGCPTSDVFD